MIELFLYQEKRNKEQRHGKPRWCLMLILNRGEEHKKKFKRKRFKHRPSYNEVINFVNRTAF